MLHYRKILMLIVSDNTLQIRLTQLVAAAGITLSKLDLMVLQGLHHSFAKIRVRFLEHQSERVIATSFQKEICFVLLRIEVIQEILEITPALFVVLIEAFQLISTDDRSDFVVSHIETGKCEYELGIQLWIFLDIFLLARVVFHFPYHAMGPKHAAHLVEVLIISAHHATFDGAHVMCKVK